MFHQQFFYNFPYPAHFNITGFLTDTVTLLSSPNPPPSYPQSPRKYLPKTNESSDQPVTDTCTHTPAHWHAICLNLSGRPATIETFINVWINYFTNYSITLPAWSAVDTRRPTESWKAVLPAVSYSPTLWPCSSSSLYRFALSTHSRVEWGLFLIWPTSPEACQDEPHPILTHRGPTVQDWPVWFNLLLHGWHRWDDVSSYQGVYYKKSHNFTGGSRIAFIAFHFQCIVWHNGLSIELSIILTQVRIQIPIISYSA